MKPNEKPAEGDAPAREEPESRAVGLLLNAPSILSKLIDTAVLLSMFTGVLYAWGSIYYYAFTQGLDLEQYAFAFNPSPNEVLFAGGNTLSYLITGVPAAYWSVAVGLGAVIVLVSVIQLFLVPALMRLAIFLKPVSAKLCRWLRRRLLKFRLLRGLRKKLKKLKPRRDDLAEYERTRARLLGSVELYVAHAVILTLLVILLWWGVEKSRQLGLEVAQRQLGNCPTVKVVFGDNETMESTLCGRIGGDYILTSKDPRGRYVVVKEAAIKHIDVLRPEPQTPQKKP
jgi:hypothetical protein